MRRLLARLIDYYIKRRKMFDNLLQRHPKIDLFLNIFACSFSMSFCSVMFWYFLIPNSNQGSDILDDLKNITLYVVYLWVFFSMSCFVISRHIPNFSKFCRFFYELIPYFILIAFIVAIFFIISRIFVEISLAHIFSLVLTQIYIVFVMNKILKKLK